MRTLIITALSASLLVFGCGKKEDGKGDEAGKSGEGGEGKPAPEPEKPIELTETADVGAAVKDSDETRYNGLKLKLPAGAAVEDSGMGLTVKFGEVSYEFRWQFEGEDPVATDKKGAESDELDELVKFHVDTPEAILFESKSALGGSNNHHFVALVKVGDKNLVCKKKGYGQFTKAQAEALLKSCQSATME